MESRAAYGLFGALCLLLCYHCALPLPAFYQYGDRSLYAAARALPGHRGKQRISNFRSASTSFSPFRTPETGFVHAFNGNFASFYRIPTLNGFDPLYQDERSITSVLDRLT